jgi:hypothetical protein
MADSEKRRNRKKKGKMWRLRNRRSMGKKRKRRKIVM